MQIHRTLIVEASYVELARQLCAAAGTAGEMMFMVGLSPDASIPASHYISNGFISEEFAAMMPLGTIPGQPEAVLSMAEASGLFVTLPEIETLFAHADISDQGADMALTRFGLKLCDEGSV